MAKNEVATTEKNFNLVTLTGEMKEAVAEELMVSALFHLREQRFQAVAFWHLNCRGRLRMSL